MELDLTARSGPHNYDLLTQTVTPRPIAWILSENEDGSLNLAPFSYFNVVASRPALLSVSIGRRRDGTPKDTSANALAGRPFVIHLASQSLVDALNASAAPLAPGTSELTHLGLATVPLAGFPLPRLADAAVAYGCRLHQAVDLEAVPQTLLIAEALRAYVDDAVLTDTATVLPSVDYARLDPLARLGRTAYAGLAKAFERDRPTG
ncbi:MAG: flavin reductase family protein [Opitutales bacterium]